MRLSELLDVEVVDEHGTVAGSVHDVRLVQDGPILGGFGASFRVAGLVIGSRTLGSRLGYDRSRVRGPWLLKAFFGRLHRGARYVDWERIRSVGTDQIVISGTAADLPHPASVP